MLKISCTSIMHILKISLPLILGRFEFNTSNSDKHFDMMNTSEQNEIVFENYYEYWNKRILHALTLLLALETMSSIWPRTKLKCFPTIAINFENEKCSLINLYSGLSQLLLLVFFFFANISCILFVCIVKKTCKWQFW